MTIDTDLAALETAYIALLRMPADSANRLLHLQPVLATLCNRIAGITGIDAEAVQATYEAKASEPVVKIIWSGPPLPFGGGPAFPCEAGERLRASPGMLLRDYFAAAALQGMNANPELMQTVTAGSVLDGSAFDRMATQAYREADAMLKARGR